MPNLKQQVQHLLDYLLAVEELKQTAPRQIPKDLLALHEVELKGLDGVHFNQRTGEQDVWLRIERLEEMAPPPPKAALEPWVELSRSPAKSPLLRNSIIVSSASDQTVKTIMLDARPDVPELFDAYIEGWRAWAERETRRRKTITLYRKLFLLQQTISNEGSDQPIELIWGMGLAAWSPPDESVSILHPLLTQSCEISINVQTFSIEVRPSVSRPKLEIACYAQLGLAGVKPLEASWRALQESEDDVLSPFEESSFRDIAETAVAQLDPDGKYDKRTDDLALPVPGPRLTVTSTWCLFARKRSGDLIIEDIKALKLDVERADQLPELVKRFVKQHTGEVIRPAPRCYRGAFSSIAANESDTAPVDLLFPLPYNDEQVSIVQRLDHADGVVVQGPPGTGKSHTIANIICHYLANGRRILVTAKSESALAVLREKLPKEIQPLTVTLLSGESDGNRQFESNVRTINEELSRLEPKRTEARIECFQAEIDKLHEEMAETDRQIDAKARPNVQPVQKGGKEIGVMELARQVVEAEPRHAWFDDVPSADLDPSLTEELIEALRQARRRVGTDLKYLDDVLPAIDALPTVDELLQTHRDLRRTAQLDAGRHQGETLALREVTASVLVDLPRLRFAITERMALVEALAVHPWARGLVSELRRAGGSDPVVATLRDLVAAIGRAEQQRRSHVAQAIEVPEGAEHDADLLQAIARLTTGGRAFLLPIGHAEQRKVLVQIRVAGSPPSHPQHWAQVEAVLAWRNDLKRVCAQWSSLAAELELPAVESGSSTQTIRELSRLADIARSAIDSVFDHDRTLVQWIARMFAPCPETSPASALCHLERLSASVDAHLEHANVTYALERRRVYQEKLAHCSGDLAISLSMIFSDALGSEMDEDSLRSRWREVNEELLRRTQLGTATQTIRSVVNLLAIAGAPLWADRLRTQPQDPSTDLDPLIPSDWANAWQWRRDETFLRKIDANQEIRRLFYERHRLSKSLARTYQELAAAKTWLAVGRHAGQDVRAALNAYLTAILAIGRGTGRTAVMFRRDAKHAMSRAYRGVPCWILPHWRVSEALPAEIGLFDLVIVDEASQSDLSCLPAILRGKKLLVVGDDKQVSPSAVGVAVETLTDLRNRYLTDFPENIGPLMLPGRSLYELANVVFAGQGVMLREHFRSVAPIIQWSNQHYYDNKIIPLRVPTASERLDPPLIDVYVRDGKRCGDVNELEAQAIIDEIKSIYADPGMAGRTIGVVTLLGTEQAHHIHGLIGEQIPIHEVLKRQISVGPPPVFQGRERHIMLISMVLDRDSHAASNANANHQRYNVALSRAQDRMVLFRSITQAEVNADSPTGRVLSYFRQPTVVESQAGTKAREHCESGFELDVYDELVERGFRVVPQVKAGPYRIDLVVEDAAGRRLAIECDGDRYHGPGQWSDDMARQRVLERAGWTFWRCFASTWARRRQDCIQELLSTLNGLGISPAPPTAMPRLVESRVYVPPTATSNGGEDASKLEAAEIPANQRSDAPQGLVDEEIESGMRREGSRPTSPAPSSGPLSSVLLDAMLSLMPSDGSAIGNSTLKRELELRGHPLSDEQYYSARQVLINARQCDAGRGRGGSVRRRAVTTADESRSSSSSAELASQSLETSPDDAVSGSHRAELFPYNLLKTMLRLLPADGSPIGNTALKRELEKNGYPLSDDQYYRARQVLIDRGECEKGQGRGGSVRRAGWQRELI